jgi:hypothetical protein
MVKSGVLFEVRNEFLNNTQTSFSFKGIKGRQVNDELERLWKEAVMAHCKVLSLHSFGGTEKNHKNLSQDS